MAHEEGSLMGLVVRDVITEFKGTVTGEAQYLSGCSQALVAPEVAGSGGLVEPHWFDVQRLRPVTPLRARITLHNEATPGCDRAAPKR